jgi:hypothetical protein
MGSIVISKHFLYPVMDVFVINPAAFLQSPDLVSFVLCFSLSLHKYLPLYASVCCKRVCVISRDHLPGTRHPPSGLSSRSTLFMVP